MTSAATRIVSNAKVHTPDGDHDRVIFSYRQGRPTAEILPRRGPTVIAESPPVDEIVSTGARTFVVTFADGSEPWTVTRGRGCGCGR
jgi:hypothetical protein